MKINSKIIVLFSLVFLIIIGVAATAKVSTTNSNHFTNLQILPKDISEVALMKIMQVDFNKGLGVKCSFCHSENKDSTGLDFAIDTKAEKKITRSMMLMTNGINMQYFKIDSAMVGNALLAVNCVTCHRGNAFPTDDLLSTK